MGRTDQKLMKLDVMRGSLLFLALFNAFSLGGQLYRQLREETKYADADVGRKV